MMYLVSTFAAGAAGLELRNLAIDSGKTKIEFNGHGLSNGNLVRASADTGGDGSGNAKGLNAGDMYVVDGATTNDFKLKTMKNDKTGDAARTFEDTTTGAGATLTKHGAKSCDITAIASKEITCAANHGMADGDAVLYYPTQTAKLFKGDFGATATAFWVSDSTADAKKLKLKKTKGAAAADAAEGTADAGAGAEKSWLLSVDTASVYSVAPKTLAADGGKWDVGTTYGGSATAAMAVCGNAECGVSDGQAYYYTAGSAATTGLTDKNVYYIDGGKGHATPYKFKVNKVDATGVTLSEGAAQAVTASGKGDTWQRVDGGERLTGSEKTGNKIVFHADKASTFTKNSAVIFWCSNTTTAADCEYNVAGMTNGAQFKIKSVAAAKAVLKASSGADDCTTACADVAVSADASTKTKGYMLKKNAETATVFPAAAAGSAARSFAMLGSAVAMATAFLLA